MAKNNPHPGVLLSELLEKKGISQRDLAGRLNIAHSQLNNILNGNRAININFALSLQAAGYEEASFWLTKQMEYELLEAQKDEELSKKNKAIRLLKEIEELVPVSFFKKMDMLTGDSEQNIKEIFKIYNVKDINGLEKSIKKYDFSKFRKSSKFTENRNNIIAWSHLAEFQAKLEDVKEFNISNQTELIEELKKCFLKNDETIARTKSILKKYGVKFIILDRPSQTPVDGKSFMSGNNPAIALSLKYSRLDNFAYNIMHELGHVYLHLTNDAYKNVNFFTNAPNIEKEEFEADDFARNNLISLNDWNEFISTHDEFDDDSILKFSKKIKVHPGIIRGRVCFENPDYYRKRTAINALNVLK